VIIEEANLKVFTHLHIGARLDAPQALTCRGLTLLFYHFTDQGHIVAHGDVCAQIDGRVFQYLYWQF
jgi:hypothetical protein